MSAQKESLKSTEHVSHLTRFSNVLLNHKKKLFGSIIISAAIGTEIHTSYLQAHLFHSIANNTETIMHNGEEALRAEVTLAPSGPYNVRNGYTNAEAFAQSLINNEYQLKARASHIPPQILGHTLYPLYDEKPQSGLRITDESGRNVSTSYFPNEVYTEPFQIPAIVRDSLLFVENRSLGDQNPRTRNPVIEWGPFSLALAQKILQSMNLYDSKISGASTLITQKTKARHTAGGRTSTSMEKLEQMLSASTAVYADDLDTSNNTQEIVQDYLNSIPFAAHGGFGEVIGFADAIAIWFGNDFNDVNRLLSTAEEELSGSDFEQYAEYYHDALALIMALPRPADLLLKDRDQLKERLNSYLPLLAENGIISERLKDKIIKMELSFNDSELDTRSKPKNQQFKARTILENRLMEQFNLSNIYDFRRLDIQAETTLNASVTATISEYLHRLSDPEFLEQEGLAGVHLKRADPEFAEDIIYGISLYERTEQGNVLRVKADTYDGEFDIHQDSKIELGSFAKLRTLITYLEIIEKLHTTYKDSTHEELLSIDTDATDQLSAWVINYLSNQDNDPALLATLQASMLREYSADHREGFRTGGGVLRFGNYEFTDYKKDFTVSEALYRSSNLAWIRIIRDVSDHIIATDLNIEPTIYDTLDHPLRSHYLNKFAKEESLVFLERFNDYFYNSTSTNPERVLIENLQRNRDLTLEHLAVIHTTLYPERTIEDFTNLVTTYRRHENILNKTEQDIQDTFQQTQRADYSLQDKVGLTSLHPIQIWVAQEFVKNPSQRPQQLPDDILQESYAWLLFSEAKNERHAERILNRQNKRIHQAIEKDAFDIIYQSWKRQGFPFDKLIPSYASVLGSSADTPAAAAELIGIIQNKGRKLPTRLFNSVHLAEDTPYEQRFEKKQGEGEQVISPEIAAVALEGIKGVVEQGTARLAHESVTLSDGRVLTIAGKTGTHDGEARIYNRALGKMETVKDDRIAVFTFALGDHHFGTITAAVLDQKAEDHKYTSSLAVKLLSNLGPSLRPILDPAYGITPEETQCAQQLSNYSVSLGLSQDHKYTIQTGDNLHSIAQNFREVANDETITVSAIQAANQEHYPNLSTPTLVAEKDIIIPFSFECKL